ncbi:allergin-1 isoform X2 [Rhinatrema bivittatum]|uniref:allergin-1 isoform X2 n=1 Tax=Rhinatrema bivittatum TaxID=194408 RepID=UPI001129B33C|nr:allergin-1 isoform X2 [Rhinatrema bivittatum]
MLPLLIILVLLLRVQAGQNPQINESASEPVLELNTSLAIQIGKLIRVTCLAKFSLQNITGNATLAISKDGNLLESAAVNSTKGGSVTYTRQPANFSDSGDYNCEFKDGKSVKRITWNITVLEPVLNPELFPNTSITMIGHNVTLSCLSSKGSLPINYTFYRENNMLSHQMMNQHTPAELSIHIKSIKDAGQYKCKVVNRLNSYKYSDGINLTIIDAIQGVNISRMPDGQDEGMVQLQCSVKQGSLPITFMWYKESANGKEMLSEARVNASASVYKFQVSGTEKFSCKALNIFTSDTSSVIEVQGKSAFSSTVIIFIAVVLILIVIALSVAVPLLILPKCKTLYDTPAEVEYTTMIFQDKDKVDLRNDASAEYAEILVKNNQGAVDAASSQAIALRFLQSKTTQEKTWFFHLCFKQQQSQKLAPYNVASIRQENNKEKHGITNKNLFYDSLTWLYLII